MTYNGMTLDEFLERHPDLGRVYRSLTGTGCAWVKMRAALWQLEREQKAANRARLEAADPSARREAPRLRATYM